jgi:hypothetical protein
MTDVWCITVNKEATSYNDIFDAFRLALSSTTLEILVSRVARLGLGYL